MAQSAICRGSNMKNSKGFSLIELIGVILLLSLLTIIIVPNVMRIIEKNEKNSFEESVKGLFRSVQNHYASVDEKFPQEGLFVTSIDFDVNNIDKYANGKILEKNGTYSAVNVTDGVYYANGKRNSLSITKTPVSEYQIDTFDFNNFANWRSGQYHLSTGVYQTYSDRLALNDYITCKPSKTYMVNLSNNSYSFIIRLMNKDKGFIKSIGAVARGNTFTTTADTVYLAVSLYSPYAGASYAVYQQLFANGLTLSIEEQ